MITEITSWPTKIDQIRSRGEAFHALSSETNQPTPTTTTTIMWTLVSSLGAVLFVMTSLSTPMTSSATKYVAKVKVYVDRMGEQHWKKVTGKTTHTEFELEMKSTFFEMNEIYKTMKPNGLDLQLQIHNIEFIGRDIINTNNGKVNMNTGLNAFKQYVGPSYATDKYDMAILYTSADLIDDKGSASPTGLASVAAVCSKRATGIVELKASFDDVLVTAHELGHIFGSYHDGSPQAPLCSSKSGEIMNPSEPIRSLRHFFFSSCTAKQIINNIKKLDKWSENCLTSYSPSDDITGPRLGTLMTPDEVCTRAYGKTSYIARMAYESEDYGDDICVSLKCLTSWVGRGYSMGIVPTPQGLNCGKNKQCIQGHCVKTSSGSAHVSDTCPFGDQPKIEGSQPTSCSRMTYDTCQRWGKACCKTCADPGTADEVCQDEFGESSALVRAVYANGYDNICAPDKMACLSEVKGKSFSYYKHTAPDGMKCGKEKRCNGGLCLKSQVGDPSISDTCPFGDQPFLAGDWKTTCSAETARHGCSGLKDVCCSSCSDPGTADEICRDRVDSDSVFLRSVYKSYGDKLCSSLACRTSQNGGSYRYTQSQAPDGMKCGKSKRCKDGKCLSTSTGDPSMSSSCPYGNQPVLYNIPGGCTSIDKRLNCYKSYFKTSCCDWCG